MKKLLKLLILPLALLMGSWTINHSASYNSTNEFGIHTPSDLPKMATPGEKDTILLRVAFLGDAEPKPLAEYPGMSAAVDQINTLGQTQHIDFVIGVGDIAHKGTEIQYQAATPVLQKLAHPFYPIMGNEEHGSTVDRFLYYAKQWNKKVDSTKYVLEFDQLAFVFASPDFSRDFDNKGAGWILEQIQRLAPKPIILIVHGAQKGVYPENRKKGIGNRMFRKKVIAQPNLAVVVSGDLHMDMDRAGHSKKIKNVQYLHIPALERTKIPDETRHTPMFRVMTIYQDGKVTVDTYAVGDTNPKKEHAYSFSITLVK